MSRAGMFYNMNSLGSQAVRKSTEVSIDLPYLTTSNECHICSFSRPDPRSSIKSKSHTINGGKPQLSRTGNTLVCGF